MCIHVFYYSKEPHNSLGTFQQDLVHMLFPIVPFPLSHILLVGLKEQIN